MPINHGAWYGGVIFVSKENLILTGVRMQAFENRVPALRTINSNFK